MEETRKDMAQIISDYLTYKIPECKELGKLHGIDKEIIDQKYEYFCENITDEIINIFKNEQKKLFEPNFESYNFYSVFVFSFFIYIIRFTAEYKDKKPNIVPYNLLISALQKYKDIVHLMENKQYESATILFRALYENLVILYFINYNDCSDTFSDFSFYKLFKKMPKNIRKEQEFGEIDKKLSFIENKYPEKDLNSNYGWARKKINKDSNIKIYFTDLLDKVIENNVNIKYIYEESSNLIHSTSSILIDSHFVPLLENNLKYYIEYLGIPIITRCFYDFFCDNYYTDANIFLRICELCMLRYNININIR